MTRVLVTGFEPFDRVAVNPSQLLVEALEQALDKNVASMPLESLVRAARVIVAECVRRRSPS